MGRRLWKNWGSAVVTFAAYFTGQFSEIPGKKFCCEYLHCHTVTECTIIQHFPNYTTTSLLRSGQALLNKLCYIEECYIEMSAPSGAVKPACVMSVSIISIAGLLWKEWVVICCLYSWLLRSVYYLPSFSGCVGQCCMMQVTGIKKHYLVLCFIVRLQCNASGDTRCLGCHWDDIHLSMMPPLPVLWAAGRIMLSTCLSVSVYVRAGRGIHWPVCCRLLVGTNVA